MQMLDMIVGRSSSAGGSELPHLKLGEGAPVALLVNSLGATTQMELMIAARTALTHARSSLKVPVPPPPPQPRHCRWIAKCGRKHERAQEFKKFAGWGANGEFNDDAECV